MADAIVIGLDIFGRPRGEIQLAAFVPASGVTEDEVVSALQEILDSGGSRCFLFVESDA